MRTPENLHYATFSDEAYPVSRNMVQHNRRGLGTIRPTIQIHKSHHDLKIALQKTALPPSPDEVLNCQGEPPVSFATMALVGRSIFRMLTLRACLRGRRPTESMLSYKS